LTASSSEMHWIGQVSTLKGGLETPEAEATTWVCPGVLGDTVTWLVATLVEEFTTGVVVTTAPLASFQVKGPTEAVISTPWLKAVACKVWI
jgi:hypothetical protein